MQKNEILMIYGKEYQKITEELLEEADLAGMIRDVRKKVGIKPNLVSPVPASLGATTHPEVIEGLICYLQKHGFWNLVIMEGSWVGDKTKKAFDVCGYRKLSEKYGVPLIDAQREPAVKIDCAGMNLNICACAKDVDFMINVPVVKGHCQTHITCALKNMKGLIPNAEKRRFHAMGLHKPIAHLSLGIHQDFILADGICGDLSYEDGGNPTEMNRLLAAADPVLLDAWVCQFLQYQIEEVPYIRMAEALGAGSADLSAAIVRELNSMEGSNRLPEKNRRVMKLAEHTQEVESCSACYGYLIPALDKLDAEGLLKDFPEKICIGQGYRDKTGILGIGNCTKGFQHSLKGCPPTEQEIYEFLSSYIKDNMTSETTPNSKA